MKDKDITTRRIKHMHLKAYSQNRSKRIPALDACIESPKYFESSVSDSDVVVQIQQKVRQDTFFLVAHIMVGNKKGKTTKRYKRRPAIRYLRKGPCKSFAVDERTVS